MFLHLLQVLSPSLQCEEKQEEDSIVLLIVKQMCMYDEFVASSVDGQAEDPFICM